MQRIPLRTVLIVSILLVTPLWGFSQHKYTVIFYNVENLFDTWDDPLTQDEEFTPFSTRHWTKQRFDEKIKMIYKSLIIAGEGQFPDVIGLAEIENRWVIEQLTTRTPLNKVPYEIIHKESPDPRGIDVALLYRSDRIKAVDFEFLPVSGYGKNAFKSRDILHFTALIGYEKVHFYVNHWPSRSGGYIETREKRDVAARVLRHNVESVINNYPNSNILIMGDFNASANERCFTSILKALPYPANDDPLTLINLSTLWTRNAEGTIKNGGQWEVFDQMICSYNLLKNNNLYINPNEGGICTSSFLLEPDKTYLGKKPFRTYMGPVYHGGISDHLPVRIYLKENAKGKGK